MKYLYSNFTIILLILSMNSCTISSKKRLPASSSNTNYCSELIQKFLANSNPKSALINNFEKNALYGINLIGNNETQYLRFQSITEENNTLFIQFQKLSDDKVIRNNQSVKIAVKDIFAMKKVSKIPEKNSYSFSIFHIPLGIIGITTNIISWSNLMFRPYKALLKKGNIEIVSKSLFAGKDFKVQAEEVFNQFSKFDKKMNDVGFFSPHLTKVVLLKQKKFLPTFDSQIIPFDILRLKNGYQHFMFLNPLLAIKNLNFGNSLMVHERAHSLLRRTYKLNSFLLQNRMYEEGFVDVLSAHFNKSPQIGMDAIVKGQSMRNLEKNIGYEIDGKVFRANSFLDIDNANNHNLSLFPSTILWKMRSENIDINFYKNIKEIINHLNHYEDSFRSSKYFISSEKNKSLFSFFMATLYKLSQENNEFKIYQKIINAHIHSLNMDSKQIEMIANSLERSSKNYHYDGPPIHSDILITMSGGLMAGLGGFITYSLLKNDDDE